MSLSIKLNSGLLSVLFVLIFAQLTACAHSPNNISKMNAIEIASVPDSNLCYTYAIFKKKRESVPIIDEEIARRNLTCEKEVEEIVSNCDELEVVGLGKQAAQVKSESNTEKGNMISVEVKNNSAKQKDFRVYMQGILSSLLTIGPGESRKYGIFVKDATSTLSALYNTVNPSQDTSEGPELYDCVTSR